MSRGRNPTKIALWTERFDRFVSEEQTVVQFCADEGVSPPSFYRWKKILQFNLRVATNTQRPKIKEKFKSVELISVPTNPSQRTTIRLIDGVEIELGNDFPVVDRILQALMHPSMQNDSLQSEGPSC